MSDLKIGANYEKLANAHLEEKKIMDEIHQLQKKRMRLHREPTHVFHDGEKFRHIIPADNEPHSIEFEWIRGEGFLAFRGLFPSLNTVTEMHYMMMRPDRVKNNNAWTECEVKRNDIWISINDLPLLPLTSKEIMAL